MPTLSESLTADELHLSQDVASLRLVSVSASLAARGLELGSKSAFTEIQVVVEQTRVALESLAKISKDRER